LFCETTPDAGAGKPGGQPVGARPVGGVADAFLSERESQSVRMKARIALDDVEQRKVSQPHIRFLALRDL
jgi:hypothetical protein